MTIPETMKAIDLTEYGGPEILKVTEIPTPQPKAGEVLIKTAFAGLNRADTGQRRGNYPPPPGTTNVPGLEVSGWIAACGPGAGAFSPGDEVCALVAGGGYAEYCVVPEQQVLPKPRNFTFIQAAAVPETFFTVWTNLMHRCRLQPGESVLVHGGSSGIGTTAIMLLKALGHTVYVTAGTAEKCARCQQLGADLAINYNEEDFVSAVNAATEDRGVDVIIDMVGDDYIPRNMEVLAVEGRMVSIALLKGATTQINLGIMMRKRLTLMGSTLRPLTIEKKAQIARELHETVWPLFESGEILPVIDSVFALSDAPKAHERMESSVHIGKIMLQVDPEAT